MIPTSFCNQQHETFFLTFTSLISLFFILLFMWLDHLKQHSTFFAYNDTLTSHKGNLYLFSPFFIADYPPAELIIWICWMLPTQNFHHKSVTAKTLPHKTLFVFYLVPSITHHSRCTYLLIYLTHSILIEI